MRIRFEKNPPCRRCHRMMGEYLLPDENNVWLIDCTRSLDEIRSKAKRVPSYCPMATEHASHGYGASIIRGKN